MSRIHIGKLSTTARKSDIEHFFRDHRGVVDILIKNGYGFVEFRSSKDAEEAIKDLNGKTICGESVQLDYARSRGPNRSSHDGRPRYMDQYGPPVRTKYRIIVENLSTAVSWQDLKDLMRKAGDVTYADAHKNRRREGLVEFYTRKDMERAVDRFDKYELNGRVLRVVSDLRESRSPDGGQRRRRSCSSDSSGSRKRDSSSGGSSRSRSRRESNGRNNGDTTYSD